MPASKKLYQELASEIADAVIIARMEDRATVRGAQLGILDVVAHKIAGTLKRDNPRFQIEKFIEACQLD